MTITTCQVQGWHVGMSDELFEHGVLVFAETKIAKGPS